MQNVLFSKATVNAFFESFFVSLICEWINNKIHDTFEDDKKAIFNSIEVFYNLKRRQA